MGSSKYWILILMLFAASYGTSVTWRKRGG